MFAKLRDLIHIFGPRWLLYRLGYSVSRRMGLLRLTCPAYAWEKRPLSTLLKPGIPAEVETYGSWRQANHPPYLVHALPERVGGGRSVLNDAEAFFRGELRYFSADLYPIGFPPNWSLDPSTGTRLPLDRHWSTLADEGQHDIKYIWEAARFSWAYLLARAYAHTHEERFAEGFWTVFEDWMQHNPPNLGPAWMDGQECALRLNAACFALAVFRSTQATTPRRVALFTRFAAATAARIQGNLSFALSTRSNHTVSEGFGLWLVGTLFPELKSAFRWRELGYEILVLQAREQLFEDGGYAMYSLNYQRFTLQLYCLALRQGEILEQPFPRFVYDRIEAASEFLYQLIEPRTGEMPEFGSNDGALVLPLNDCHFNDYRPLIQLCHYTANRQRLFPPGAWDEDTQWLFGDRAMQLSALPLPRQESRAFSDAGVFTLRSEHAVAVLRCPHYRARPSHADPLHVDLWIEGTAVAVDAGTFSYHAPPPWNNGLSGIARHNTVMVDKQEPMIQRGRFTWGSWANGRLLRREPDLLVAEHDGYHRLSDPVYHQRAIAFLPGERILVVDRIDAFRHHHYQLHWLLVDCGFTLLENAAGLLINRHTGNLLVRLGSTESAFSFNLMRADPNSTRGWCSRTYGQREAALSLQLETNAASAVLFTLFGRHDDQIIPDHESLALTIEGKEIRVDVADFFVNNIRNTV
jgi:asparagine synthase (glutamine-hydrolysing)